MRATMLGSSLGHSELPIAVSACANSRCGHKINLLVHRAIRGKGLKDGIVGLAADVAHLVRCCRNQQKMKMRLGFGSVFGACLGALVVVPVLHWSVVTAGVVTVSGAGAVVRRSLQGFLRGRRRNTTTLFGDES